MSVEKADIRSQVCAGPATLLLQSIQQNARDPFCRIFQYPLPCLGAVINRKGITERMKV